MPQGVERKGMLEAIKSAVQGITRGHGGPFGACLVRGRSVVAVDHNRVLQCSDATAHAEINVIRAACRKIRNFDLSGHALYTTTEPCPMCFAAIHWARIDRVIFGTRIADAARRGFNELAISSRMMKSKGCSAVRIKGGWMRRECEELFRAWDRLETKRVY